MSISDLFSDNNSYDFNEDEENPVVSDDCEFEITEDEVKEMLFDDDFDAKPVIKAKPSKDCSFVENSNEKSYNDCSETQDEPKALTTESNLAAVTENETGVTKNYFRSERNIAIENTRKQNRDIPDSLDSVVIDVDIKKRKKRKKLKPSNSQSGKMISPHKIHVNPHFRASLKQTTVMDSSVCDPFAQTLPPNSILPFRTTQHQVSDHKPPALLALPNSTSFLNNNQQIHPFGQPAAFNKQSPSFVDQLLLNNASVTQSFSSANSFHPFVNTQRSSNQHFRVHQQQTPFNEPNFWSPALHQNELTNSVWSNPPHQIQGNNLSSQSGSYLMPKPQASLPPPVYTNNFSYSGHGNQIPFRGPLCPNPPQQPSPHVMHQSLPFQDQNMQPSGRFLPQHVFAARFPQQYPPSRPELPNFPRPEPVPGLAPPPLPPIERHQAPLIMGTTRTLLPRPILPHPPPQSQPQMPPPRPQMNPISQQLQMTATAQRFNVNYGILQPPEFRNNSSVKGQYQQEQRGTKRNEFSSGSPKKFLKNNKSLKVKYSGLKTVCNGTENERKVALNKTKMAKKFLQKRPNNCVKQVSSLNANKTEAEPKQEFSEKVEDKAQLIDLEVDEEYKRKLEEQKLMREEILKRKEERRRQMAQQKLQEAEAQKSKIAPCSSTTTVTRTSSPLTSAPQSNKTLISQKNSPIKTLVNRNTVRCQIQTQHRERQVVQLKQQSIQSRVNSTVNNSAKKTVQIKGLALSTSESAINKLCNAVGQVKSVKISEENGEKKALVVFESPKDASLFQHKYQRHLLDLCVIQVVVKNLNNDENLVFCFNAVLICNGHHFKPSIPSINGLKLFKGEVIHTHSYKTPTNYSNKTVVVIGFGNSAVDAACDLALVCEKIYLSTRSGGWIQSRLGPAGYPFDGIYNTRAFRYLLNYLPPVIVSKLAERRANQRFDHEMFGVKSSHHIFSKQFIVNKCKLPSTERMLAEIAADYEKKKSDFDENSEIRHSLRVEFIPYMDRLASEIGAKPNLWRLFFTDFKLWFHLMFGPCVSYQYRLFGPNKWREARKTIIRTNHRIRAAFSSWCRKSEENVRRDANFNNQICNEKE
ncbi:dimethylaniline monooxygenase [N-oxide-forming] 5-like protein [Dinothrombium tinctorium]|uniref:Flavin-containing monooxygenase n=1 Tax=Dinothrombium tinctorium TaxID=1965070 RepID=A0A443RQ28_9ACAR|nr:dimethylaniline monooxygenase [N-oxide-forming] 5-like protein [Dinothrombium tinctorium]